MEATFETLVVMTPTGEFISVPWQKEEIPALGSEIEVILPKTGLSFFSLKKLAVIAASFVLLFLGIFFVSEYLFFQEQQIVAYVGIDINPSLELGVDKDGFVKEAIGLNEDGKGLLAGLNFENHTVDQAVKLITQEAVTKQYLAADKENNIILTLCTQEERNIKTDKSNTEEQLGATTEVFNKIKNDLISEIKDELNKQNIEAQVELLEIQPKFYARAKKAEISPGKYAVVLEAINEGIAVSPEDVKFSSVVKAIKDAGGNPGQIIAQTKKNEKQLLKLEKEMKKRLKKQQEDNNNGENPVQRKGNFFDKDKFSEIFKDKFKDTNRSKFKDGNNENNEKKARKEKDKKRNDKLDKNEKNQDKARDKDQDQAGGKVKDKDRESDRNKTKQTDSKNKVNVGDHVKNKDYDSIKNSSTKNSGNKKAD